jgi:hypothetical protein
MRIYFATLAHAIINYLQQIRNRPLLVDYPFRIIDANCFKTILDYLTRSNNGLSKLVADADSILVMSFDGLLSFQ